MTQVAALPNAQIADASSLPCQQPHNRYHTLLLLLGSIRNISPVEFTYASR